MEKKKNTDFNESDMFMVSRAFAAMSVVAAHLSFRESYVGAFLERIGTIGVVAFFIMSGFFFRPNKFVGYKDLLKKKLESIIIPWIILGSAMWGVYAVLSEKFRSVPGYFEWILGKNTYLYYVPMLILCLLFFYKIKPGVIFFAIPVTGLSVAMTSSGITDGIVEKFGITNHLNILNWIGFFAIGIIMQSVEGKILPFIKKFRCFFLVTFVSAVLLLTIYKSFKADYFSYIAIPYELLGTAAIFSLSTFDGSWSKVMKKVSECSYSIYLCHMPMVGLLDGFLEKSIVLQILSPAIIVLITTGIIYAVGYVFQRMGLGNWYYKIIGVRSKKI